VSSSEVLTNAVLTVLKEHLAGMREDLRAEIQGPAQTLANRTIELGIRAAAGDQLALENLGDMKAQALLLAGETAAREADRAMNTVRMILAIAVRTLVAAAAL
jgi:hypothetical protein